MPWFWSAFGIDRGSPVKYKGALNTDSFSFLVRAINARYLQNSVCNTSIVLCSTYQLHGLMITGYFCSGGGRDVIHYVLRKSFTWLVTHPPFPPSLSIRLSVHPSVCSLCQQDSFKTLIRADPGKLCQAHIRLLSESQNEQSTLLSFWCPRGPRRLQTSKF